METTTDRALSRIPVGRTATVSALAGGREFQSRLVSMGLKVGSRIRVIRSGNGGNGPTLVALGETRLAIGRGMADKIRVVLSPDVDEN